MAFRTPTNEPLRNGSQYAEMALDAMAAERFRISELSDPLREYGTWSRSGAGTILRHVSTTRLAVQLSSEWIVTDPEGKIRNQPAPNLQWHPSFAYFRRSQVTEDLHESYRNLFLALEALLSEVYPWEHGIGETQWLESALRHVIVGYGLDLSTYLERHSSPRERRSEASIR